MPKKPYAECTMCSSQTSTYSSASEALQHLHTAHFECPLGEKGHIRTKHRPYDDPCYAYIKSAGNPPEATSNSTEMTREFVDRLSDISGHLNKLHWLVATNPRDNPQRRQGGATVGPPLPPQLPRSLVYAFDELVACYVLHAKSLSLENRAVLVAGQCRKENQWEDYPIAQQLFHRSERIRDRWRDTRGRVKEHLQQARRDIILSRGEPDSAGNNNEEALGTRAMDTTSLVRALNASVLNGTFSMPLSLRRAEGAASNTRSTNPSPKDSKWDVIGIYTEYSKRLRAEAARRPRRRLFLDIHALEDELMALHDLLSSASDRIGL